MIPKAQVPSHQSSPSDLRQHHAKFEHLSQWGYFSGTSPLAQKQPVRLAPASC